MILKRNILITGSRKAGKTICLKHWVGEGFQKSPIYGVKSPFGEIIEQERGILKINERESLIVHAMPGQRQFKPLFSNVLLQALGAVIILDHRRVNPLEDIKLYAENIVPSLFGAPLIFAINYWDSTSGLSLEDYQEKMAELGLTNPIIPVDLKDKNQAIWLLEILLKWQHEIDLSI